MTVFKHSAVYTDALTDTVYVATGDQVRPLFGSAANRTGRWRTPKFITRQWPGYSWGRVYGSLTAAATVRLYVDEVLAYTTPAIITTQPFRLPPVRGAMWELELECAGRAVGVTLATTIEELLAHG